ncbi:unnamed protein product [Adineta ricciae]|uniref:Uncharacterized protein n=1 Tax=Adineta ricciae TaxID=249248 RepID=A0A813UXY5_ADIRI|nr:unnamed protein product [Adineta ricciae]
MAARNLIYALLFLTIATSYCMGKYIRRYDESLGFESLSGRNLKDQMLSRRFHQRKYLTNKRQEQTCSASYLKLYHAYHIDTLKEQLKQNPVPGYSIPENLISNNYCVCELSGTDNPCPQGASQTCPDGSADTVITPKVTMLFCPVE